MQSSNSSNSAGKGNSLFRNYFRNQNSSFQKLCSKLWLYETIFRCCFPKPPRRNCHFRNQNCHWPTRLTTAASGACTKPAARDYGSKLCCLVQRAARAQGSRLVYIMRQSKMASVSLQRCVELQPGDRDGNIVLQRCGSLMNDLLSWPEFQMTSEQFDTRKQKLQALREESEVQVRRYYTVASGACTKHAARDPSPILRFQVVLSGPARISRARETSMACPTSPERSL